MSLGTNIAIMNLGVIQQCDTPENIYNKPNNVFVADFIGSPPMNLISGKLINKNNKFVFLPDGGSLDVEIPIGNYDFRQIINDSNLEVLFGIRPEHIHHKKTSEHDFEVSLSANLSEYIGHEQIITFDYFKQELLGKFPSTVKIEMNKDMNLYFDLNQISLFNKESKERI